MSKKIIYGRARKFQNGKWSKWKDLKANDVKPDEGAKIGHSVCTLNMGFGRATIKYYPRMLTEKRREEVADSCRKCRKYRQYKMGLQCEPRVHVLFSDNVELGYRYHTVSMKPFPLSSQPVIESLASDLASYHELPNNSWNIGCNAVVYSDGRQSIGWHADDTQGEDIVHTYVAEAPADTHRSVLFRTKRCRKGKGMSPKEGDEEYSFNIRSGDAYEMNGPCNMHYEHCLPKTPSVKGLRSALVFRQGRPREIWKDSGAPVEGLSSPPRPGGFFGHPHHRKVGGIAIVEGGGLHSRSDLVSSGAHRFEQRGIDGNEQNGVYAIVVSRQDKNKREGDGLSWLTYTSSTAQGAKAMATSCCTAKPIRVFRSSLIQGGNFAPLPRAKNATSYRYDGLYVARGIVNGHRRVVKPGPMEIKKEYTFYLERFLSSGESAEKSEHCNSLSARQLWEEIMSNSDKVLGKRIPATAKKPLVRKRLCRQVAKEEKVVEGSETDSNEDKRGAGGWIVENSVITLMDDSGLCEGRLVHRKMASCEDKVVLSHLKDHVGEEDKLLLLKLADNGNSNLAKYFQSKRSFRVYRCSGLNSPFAPNPTEEGSLRDDGFYGVTEAHDENGNFVDESNFDSSEEKWYWFVVERLSHAIPDVSGRQNFLSAKRLWESVRQGSPGTIKAYDDRDDADYCFCFNLMPRFSKRQKIAEVSVN